MNKKQLANKKRKQTRKLRRLFELLGEFAPDIELNSLVIKIEQTSEPLNLDRILRHGTKLRRGANGEEFCKIPKLDVLCAIADQQCLIAFKLKPNSKLAAFIKDL